MKTNGKRVGRDLGLNKVGIKSRDEAEEQTNELND
jgi:hypothetical protein